MLSESSASSPLPMLPMTASLAVLYLSRSSLGGRERQSSSLFAFSLYLSLSLSLSLSPAKAAAVFELASLSVRPTRIKEAATWQLWEVRLLTRKEPLWKCLGVDCRADCGDLVFAEQNRGKKKREKTALRLSNALLVPTCGVREASHFKLIPDGF